MPRFMSDKQTQNWWDKLEGLNITIKTSNPNPNPKKNPTIYKKKNRNIKDNQNRALYANNHVQPKQPYGSWCPQQTTKQCS